MKNKFLRKASGLINNPEKRFFHGLSFSAACLCVGLATYLSVYSLTVLTKSESVFGMVVVCIIATAPIFIAPFLLKLADKFYPEPVDLSITYSYVATSIYTFIVGAIVLAILSPYF
jgi:hypothetical protein